ncbi:MAG: transcription initiation factor TFIIIB, Brf1 subunit/Transcription initiation factor TFIIB [Haloquadratum walsbyi J07HQW2]|jgi:Transcription initiation factor IIB (TFIIB)|uniref:Transcription initiation factor IIB n=1 Tax=Haloquadratum walsbyi J07HQW2 TaxID=1238425 RepID=U1MTU4_9EURY|nr:transcription initiation factor IIB [Haloquadratum walsbyi]ERG93714.1 MAG: transcription initiation factor TFIIIB, Brf1 subunit/Transcription initiation factor TFIIB [Haloquadratum walsbyi J07HQW2]
MDRLVGKTIRESQRQDSEETQTKQGKQIEIVTCPDCDTQSIIRDESHGERHCHECGLVVSENEIDHGPEWRAFNPSDQESKSRVGSPTRKSMHDKGLTTTIDWKNKDTFGRILSPKKRSQMLRLRKWQQRIRTKDSNERNLQFALSEIDRMASALGLSQQIRETASVIYRTALRNDLIRGRSIEGVTSASLYAACRQNSIPRSLSEISQVARVNRKEIGRTYRYVSSHIGLELEPVDPKKYVPRFCSRLEVSNRVEQQANEIIDETAEAGLLSGRSPTGFAAAAIYSAALLCNEKKTQREVANVSNVTEVTIRNRYQEQIATLQSF